MSKWYAHRMNKDTGLLEKKIIGNHGPFSNIYNLIEHYSKEMLFWDDDKVKFTEDYFRQISGHKKGYYEFLIENKHIFVFDFEPTQTELQNIESELNK